MPLVCLAAFALLSGCGGSSDSSAKALSKTQFQKRAKALCEQSVNEYFAKAEKALIAAQERGRQSYRQIEVVIVRNILIPQLEAKVEALRRLGSPDGGAKQLETILRAMEDVIEGMKSDPAGFLREQQTYQFPFAKPQALAKKFGLAPACVEA